MRRLGLAQKIPERSVGDFAVQHFTVTRDQARLEAVKNPRSRILEGSYTRLMRGRRVFMSDTPDEWLSNSWIIHVATGDVLVFGLGVGMILDNLCAKKMVTSVTVVELHPEVIELVGPHVAHPKLTIVKGDAFTWKPEDDQRYDVIWFDIWGDYSTSLLPEMGKLMRRTSHWKRDRRTALVGCWKREELKAEKRRGCMW